jgi:conjugative relaxase-like TrwC/TraI family protein
VTVLTCQKITPEKAKSYFLKGYYLQGTSRWSGKGAKTLGLKGAIDNEKVFGHIVDGYSPSGRKRLMGKKLGSDQERRAATDCTFSAPKSVTITALIGGDDRLIEAHLTAVAKSLELIENRYAHTRLRQNGDRVVINTGNLVIAQFDHIEARKVASDLDSKQPQQEVPDPHLHTHCLVMNMTELSKGKWYSHLNEAIFANKKMLGMVYQHYLAIEVQKLGYEIEAKEHGQFDIKGYSEQDLMEFSKRRQKILEKVGENSTKAERELAWKETRANKESFTPHQLKAFWRSEAQRYGLKIVQPSQPQLIEENLATRQNLDDEIALRALPEAIAHCSERAVAFKQEDLEKFILSLSKPMDVTKISNAIADSEELIKVPETDKIRFTTQAALMRELSTICMMQQGKGTVEAISAPTTVDAILTHQSLTTGQREAIATALTTTDQFIAWQGVAGAGKTYALNQFKNIAQQNGYLIKGFAPSAEAAKVLADEVGIETNTVASLLCSKVSNQFEPNQIWVIDEAGLLSAASAYDLLQRAVAQKARIILVGDTRQLSAVEAGNPFKSLQQAGIKTAFLEQSLRQRTPHLQVAVDLIASGEIEKGFTRLDESGCIEELSNDEEKIERIAADYLALAPGERDETLVLAGTNYERLSITGRIREGLKAEGSLGKSTNVTQLKAKDLTSVQMKYVHNFEIGDMVMPIKSYKKRGLEKRRLYQVVSKTLDTLTLRDENGMTYRVDPNFEKAVFSPSEIEIASGDRLRWTHNDRDARRRNGQEFKIIKLDKASATIEYADGTQENLDLTLPLHLDYALVSTTYSSQGKTANRVLIAADHTVASESFYVAVSRVKDELKLYTTDKEEILDKACVSKAKENPLEVLQNALATEAKSLRSTQKSAQPPTPTTDENDSYYNQARIHNNSEIDEQITRSHYEQKLPDFLARQQQLDRLAYENLARRIKQLPEFKKASPEAVDTAIAKAILSQSNDFEEVGRILTQCDLAQQWRKDLSTEQDIARLSQYIEEVCAEATKQLETIHYRTKELER